MRSGDRVKGYTIIGEIGRGGMCIVYLARDPRSSKEVVVKQLKRELSSDPEFVRRFQQAASITLNLRHPHLAYALDYVEQDGEWLMVEEYLLGGVWQIYWNRESRSPNKRPYAGVEMSCERSTTPIRTALCTAT